MPTAAARSKSRNNSGNSRQPPDLPLRDRVAAELQTMAAEAQCAELAAGAADPGIAGDTVYRLMAHQLAAGHALTMSLGAHAGRLMREARAGIAGEPDGSRRSLEMLRFVAGTARLMERCRSAALALDRIGFPEVPEVDPEDDGPHNCKHRRHRAWILQTERAIERKCVLDWLAQGKKAADLPDVEGWPPYHNPDPDIEKVDERLKPELRRLSWRPAPRPPQERQSGRRLPRRASLRRNHPCPHFLPPAGDGQRPLPLPRRQEHRPAHRRGPAALEGSPPFPRIPHRRDHRPPQRRRPHGPQSQGADPRGAQLQRKSNHRGTEAQRERRTPC